MRGLSLPQISAHAEICNLPKLYSYAFARNDRLARDRCVQFYGANELTMEIELSYINQLNELRKDSNLLSNYSIDSAQDKNWNQINRNRVLIALYNDCIASDYEIADFLFDQEKRLRQCDLEMDDYDIDVLYLAAFILTKFNRVEDIWKFLDAKNTDFDSSIGLDIEYLLSPGIEKVMEFLNSSNHPDKEAAIDLITENLKYEDYTPEEIEEWKVWKHEYFSVFEFPIKDQIEFASQARDYALLKQLSSETEINREKIPVIESISNTNSESNTKSNFISKFVSWLKKD